MSKTTRQSTKTSKFTLWRSCTCTSCKSLSRLAGSARVVARLGGQPSLAKKVRIGTMDIGECGNDRPGFGVNSVSQNMSSNNYKRFLEFYGGDMSVIYLGSSAPLTSEFECSGMVVCLHPLPVHASAWPSVAAPNRGLLHAG